MAKIYDCFCFFNELDLLEMRLNILDPYVDYFVISEASVTHTGVAKPYYFEENKERFSKFLHKIIHLNIEDTPDDFINLPSVDVSTPDGLEVAKIHEFIKAQTNRFDRRTQIAYGRDFYQKECVRRGLVNCDDNDIILFSDCDEIPNPYVMPMLFPLLQENKFYSLMQTGYYYFLNMHKENNWKGTRVGKYKDLKNYSYNELRGNDWIPLSEGGWHFSYMGGPEKVKHKIESFSAQEMNNSHVINSINNNISNDIDPFFRSQLTKVEIDDTFPKFLRENLDKYVHMIK